MQAQIEKRLNDLRNEYQNGQKMLADLQAREADLQQTLLRISGAIQVLEEMLGTAAQATTDGVGDQAMGS